MHIPHDVTDRKLTNGLQPNQWVIYTEQTNKEMLRGQYGPQSHLSHRCKQQVLEIVAMAT